VHSFTKENLKQRDPEGKSLFNDKLRKLKLRPHGQQIPFSPKGPKDKYICFSSSSLVIFKAAADIVTVFFCSEVMSPDLIEFVFGFVATGSLEVQIYHFSCLGGQQ